MATTLAKDAGMIKLLGFSGDTILGAVAAAEIYKKAKTPGGFAALAKGYGPATLPQPAAPAPVAAAKGGKRKYKKTQKKRRAKKKMTRKN